MARSSPAARAGVAALLLSSLLMAACGGGGGGTASGPAPTAASVAPTSGTTAGGTAVVLTGTNLVAGATVTVGGAAATVGTITATTVAFTTPAHAAGAVDVVVTNPDGQSATLPGGFTYVAPTDQAWVVPDAAPNLTTGAGNQVEAFAAGGLYVNAHTAGHGSGEIRGQLDVAGDVRLASLDTAQEGLTGAGFGAGILTIDGTTRAARGFVIASGLTSITNAHVHQGARGTSGGPVITLVSGGTKDLWVVPDGTVVSQAVADAFQAGTLYYNVHTAANPNGEIRGQLDKKGTLRLCSLDAAQEPGSTSTVLGAGIIAVDEASGAVSGFAITTPFGTGVTNAHVHGPAARGTNATPKVQMTFGPTLVAVPDGAPAISTGAGSQTADFLAGNYYVNVHTSALTGGEIRGQLDKTGEVRVAALDGAQEVPAVTTSAFGAGLVAVDGSSGQVSGFIVTRGLVSPTIAHIHRQARGTSGPPITDLAK